MFGSNNLTLKLKVIRTISDNFIIIKLNRSYKKFHFKVRKKLLLWMKVMENNMLNLMKKLREKVTT